MLNVILCYLTTNTSNAVHWVDTAGNFSIAKASSILTRFVEGVSTNTSELEKNTALPFRETKRVLNESSCP